ncbi:hypothetical protein ETU08_09335 [Apibacter muscae]|uniref:hypothetical protein n=1 Tax=Apibacter muscae TaxID=2509004 RepID=UPI0011ADF021|nr:hypothetical protein [Apibacter muscae]TWP27914.1 hypothetical protein ETU08_09335 [Apibacter muscae]
MFKKLFITHIFIISSILNAQIGVGINTNSPEATLHIKMKENINYSNAISVRSLDQSLKFNLDGLGLLKFGEENSPVPVDVRINSNSSVIKVGNTSLSAEEAQAGALRYKFESEIFECSNGEQWLVLNYDTPPDHLIAVNNFKKVLIPNNVYTKLTGWEVKYESRVGDFINDTYTVPVTGMYILSFSVFTNMIQQPSSSYFKGEWVKIEGGVETPIIQAKNNFLSSGVYMLGISCTGTVRLNEGDKIQARVIHNSGDGRYLRVDVNNNAVAERNFNSLSIIRVSE